MALWVAAVLIISCGALALKEDDRRFEISKNLDIFTRLFREVNTLYVDTIEPEKLIQSGIDAMLKSLDPYTVFYPESKRDELKMMMTGEYAGIGSVIGQKGDYVTIREPYKGSPAHKAGLLPGDLLLSIDNEDMKGKSVSEVSARLKGQPGKNITLKIKRIGIEKPIEKQLVREVVQILPIAWQGMLNDKIGYIYFTNFTDRSAEDVRRAILELKEQGAKSLVLDMRSNGGGLLDQAVEIANFFLPKKSLIVNTKGKMSQWDKEYVTQRAPLVPDMEVAVLIDRHSASATEIVSGALQDYDRAVVIGERSFGKGLVQATRDLLYNTSLKITTAKYYIPSGRSIQAVDYTHRNPDGSVGTIPDSLITAYQTKAGRTVYDGGGITPDIRIEPRTMANVTQELLIQDLLFDFVNEYAARNTTIASPAAFEVSDALFAEFKAFVKSKDFEYETASQIALDKLVATAKAERYYDQVAVQVEKLRSDLGHSVDRDLELFRSEIEEMLADQLMERYYMQEGLVEYRTREDHCILEAVRILSDKKVYREILSVGSGE